MQNIVRSLLRRFNSLRKRGSGPTKKYYRSTTAFLKRRPLASFFISLGLLLLILIVGNIFRQQPAEAPQTLPSKSVRVFNIGDSPKATFQAKIEKSGVVQIIAQTGGVVQRIAVSEGDRVGKGSTLIVLSSNYQGGNAPAVQSQIAKTQYQNALDTFDQQKGLIQKQREVANVTDENADEMRDIQRQSIDETNNLLNANQSQLDQMRQSLESLQASGATDQQTLATIATLTSGINQLQGGVNQLRQGQRNTHFASGNDNPPARLSDLQKDITLKQLDLQEKTLSMNKEISRLQLSLAYISEATMYPASPFAGTVERINVNVGQLVSPGTVLATVVAEDIATTAVLTVPGPISKIILSGEPSELVIGGKRLAVTPYHVSTQATDGQLYSVLYDIPKESQSSLVANEYVTIHVPIAPAEVVAALDPFIPVDAVYQTQDKAYVLVAQNGKAVTKEVTLGNVYGSYVEALRGISSGDQIILDRTVIAGEKVSIQ
jgi:HlyD family secretion protein